MHIKRNKMPKEWPIPRKGTKYIAKSSHGSKNGLPVLFALREILGVVKTRKEASYAMRSGEIRVNNKVRTSDKFPLHFFDVLSLDKMSKHYRLIIENGKFVLKEISAKESDKKITKIGGKKILGNGKIQMNLEDGVNIISKDSFSVGDSVVINLKENKIEKVLPLKVGANVEVIRGKHAGERGKIKEIVVLRREKRYSIELKEITAALPLKTLIVIE